ncbi:MAG: GNAT family N-acetyltransferase [Clostridia bacterium]|nr:GNAT family N-acetyltransferase [Clostridia bacterium]
METDRLIIDRIKETDKEDYFYNISHDKKVLQTFMCKYTETPDELDFAPYLNNGAVFAIRLKETGRLIGIILYFDEKEDSCEIGYAIGSAYHNNGYATEAAGRFIRYCFEEKGFKTVSASFFAGNEASKRVMEKCGMTFCRYSKNELTYLGIERDLIYYSITSDKASGPV